MPLVCNRSKSHEAQIYTSTLTNSKLPTYLHSFLLVSRATEPVQNWMRKICKITAKAKIQTYIFSLNLKYSVASGIQQICAFQSTSK